MAHGSFFNIFLRKMCQFRANDRIAGHSRFLIFSDLVRLDTDILSPDDKQYHPIQSDTKNLK